MAAATPGSRCHKTGSVVSPAFLKARRPFVRAIQSTAAANRRGSGVARPGSQSRPRPRGAMTAQCVWDKIMPIKAAALLVPLIHVDPDPGRLSRLLKSASRMGRWLENRDLFRRPCAVWPRPSPRPCACRALHARRGPKPRRALACVVLA